MDNYEGIRREFRTLTMSTTRHKAENELKDTIYDHHFTYSLKLLHRGTPPWLTIGSTSLNLGLCTLYSH